MPARLPTHRAPGAQITASGRRRDERQSHSKRGYDRTWEKFRDMILTERPLCQDCLPDRVEPSTEVHHIIKLRVRPDLRLDPTNVSALCKPCHSVRTARGE